MNQFRKLLFFVACHVPITVQFELLMDRPIRNIHYGDFAPDGLARWASYLQQGWIPLLTLCLSIGLIGAALKSKSLEPVERYFWSLAVLINPVIAAPIFYWMRLREMKPGEQV